MLALCPPLAEPLRRVRPVPPRAALFTGARTAAPPALGTLRLRPGPLGKGPSVQPLKSSPGCSPVFRGCEWP